MATRRWWSFVGQAVPDVIRVDDNALASKTLGHRKPGYVRRSLTYRFHDDARNSGSNSVTVRSKCSGVTVA
jgi:hypothetical protein